MFGNRYNHLLIVLFAVLLAFPFLKTERLVVPLLFLAALIPALASVLKRTLLMGLIVLAVLMYGLLWLGHLAFTEMYQQTLMVTVNSVYAALLVWVIVLLNRDVLGAKSVNLDTIRGGIGIYLLLGFVWAIFYSLCAQLLPNAFSKESIALLYFSFTTLEALAGQIYLTVFIARLVGLQVVQSH
jgi:hypothetical protein